MTIIKKPYSSEEAKKTNLENKKITPKITNFQNNILIKNEEVDKNGIHLKSIEELHNNAINQFNLMEKEQNLTYDQIYNKIISIYDLDENINKFFLLKLNEYYLNNKKEIDNDTTGRSDEISIYFFTYIFTLKYEERIQMYEIFNYYGENELFLDNDRKYIYKDSLELVFKKFIRELLTISLSIDNNTLKKDGDRERENYYISQLKELYNNYTFPSGLDYKIPIKFGNKELMYINFIIKIQNIFCIDDKGNNGKIFFKYNIMDKLLALNYFSNYLLLDEYEIINIEYLIFCLYVFFRYYDQKYIEVIQYFIKKEFLICSKFLYQDFQDKIKNIKEIQEFITNDIDLDKIDENYFKNNLLEITYENKTIKINPLNYFFCGNNPNHLKEIINQTNYSFEYCKKNNFQLFLNNNELNEEFNLYVQKIMNSNLTLEYIQSLNNVPNIKESIFKNNKIINEINYNTYYVRFPLENILGVTDKETFSIFINNKLENKKEPMFINFTTSKIITKSHENLNHILRLLFNINGINIEKYTPRNGKIFKKPYYNKITNDLKDQGDKWERIIFGEKINKIFIMGCLQILNISNFKLTIKEFRKKFIAYNKYYNIKEINNALKKAKENTDNTILKDVNSFRINDDDYWLNEVHCIDARNGVNEEEDNPQSISYGFCGTDHPY